MKLWRWLLFSFVFIVVLVLVANTLFPEYFCGYGFSVREAGQISVADAISAFEVIANYACPALNCTFNQEQSRYPSVQEIVMAVEQFKATGSLPSQLHAAEIPTRPGKSFLFWAYYPKATGWIYRTQNKSIMMGPITFAVDTRGNLYREDSCF